MYSPRLVEALNGIANEYGGLIERAVKDVLSQPRYSNTGAGVGSVRVEVIAGDSSKAPAINVTFDDHLIMLNNRKLQWTRLPNINELMKWASTKKDNEKEAKQLAWATAWNQKKYDIWNAKPWRKRSLSQVLKSMNEELLKKYDEAIEADLVEATKR